MDIATHPSNFTEIKDIIRKSTEIHEKLHTSITESNAKYKSIADIKKGKSISGKRICNGAPE